MRPASHEGWIRIRIVVTHNETCVRVNKKDGSHRGRQTRQRLGNRTAVQARTGFRSPLLCDATGEAADWSFLVLSSIRLADAIS